MMYGFILLVALSILASPVSVHACEGECIVDVTNAFVGNYTVPVQHVYAELAASLAKMLPARSTAAASKLVEPLLEAYEHAAYKSMEQAIFPGYFHGKCQVNGVDPDGCPNPGKCPRMFRDQDILLIDQPLVIDCPVVCGTPGSMVHFYSVLTQIAFNVTSTNLNHLCSPSSNAYKTFEKAALREIRAAAPRRRSLRSARVASRLAPYALAHRSNPVGTDSGLLRMTDLNPPLQKRGEISVAQTKAQLKSLCTSSMKRLESECGGKAGLPKCSWEKKMKSFILSFP